MYRPPAFDESDPTVLHRLIAEIGMGVLISPDLEATHIPWLLEPEPAPLGCLVGHVAKANAHWQALSEAQEVLVVFPGANAYVSPSWYPSKQKTAKVLPTWNYVAVHAYGRPETFDDPADLRDVVARLTDAQEARFAEPWSLDDAPADFTAAMLANIVGIRVRLTRIEGKRKLSQNRPEEDRAGVEDALARSERPENALLAREMKA
ncbi:MAG: FMN-binding negative transcriptional regulator [Alphaproteobacteria bacterium]|jgi:transcriptional regulator|nr:FMN-binding negative transcriptional regulator [Alphaproteobacteria bacterium]